jgi:acetyl esterase
MFVNNLFLITISVFISTQLSFGQKNKVIIHPEKIVYKIIDTTQLKLHVYRPLDFDTNTVYSSIIFFHGGGWNNGHPDMFKRQAMYFASRGMIAISAEYRIKNTHQTTPFEAVQDAKSAMRYVREHAKALHINPDMIAAGGGSAGGHLAAVCGNIEGLNALTDNTNISAVPNALVLLNPVIDNGPNSFGYRRFMERYKEISPIHNISKEAPPTIILSGTKDKIIPITSLKSYQRKMEANGNRCDLVLYENVGHAFFAKPPIKYFIETTHEIDVFLQSLAFVKGQATIKIQYSY